MMRHLSFVTLCFSPASFYTSRLEIPRSTDRLTLIILAMSLCCALTLQSNTSFAQNSRAPEPQITLKQVDNHIMASIAFRKPVHRFDASMLSSNTAIISDLKAEDNEVFTVKLSPKQLKDRLQTVTITLRAYAVRFKGKYSSGPRKAITKAMELAITSDPGAQLDEQRERVGKRVSSVSEKTQVKAGGAKLLDLLPLPDDSSMDTEHINLDN